MMTAAKLFNAPPLTWLHSSALKVSVRFHWTRSSSSFGCVGGLYSGPTKLYRIRLGGCYAGTAWSLCVAASAEEPTLSSRRLGIVLIVLGARGQRSCAASIAVRVSTRGIRSDDFMPKKETMDMDAPPRVLLAFSSSLDFKRFVSRESLSTSQAHVLFLCVLSSCDLRFLYIFSSVGVRLLYLGCRCSLLSE